MWKEMKWHQKRKWHYPKPRNPKNKVCKEMKWAWAKEPKKKCEMSWNDTKRVDWNYPQPRNPKNKMSKGMKWHQIIKWNHPKPRNPQKIEYEKK